MSADRLATPLSRELGGKTASVLDEQLGLRTTGDLLRHLPRRYARRGEMTPLGGLVEGEHATVVAEVVSSRSRPMRQRSGYLVEGLVTDGTSQLVLTFFARHRGGVEHALRQMPVGRRALFAGKVQRYRGQMQLVHPEVEPLPDDADEALVRAMAEELVPIYPATAKVQTWTLARAVRTVLATLRSDEVEDPLPAAVREREQLPGLADAFVLAHQPTDEDQHRRALRRFRYEEAFVLQVALARRRAAAAVLTTTPYPERPDGLLAAFDARLPFELTAGQREVASALAADLARPSPMNRLLQGEVGSGKTVLALRAMLAVVDGGAQAALLAPTEVLAAQHHRSITAMLGDLAQAGRLGGADVATRVALLTGSLPAAAKREALLEAVSGQAGIVVGTHALLQDRVEFADLGLVVVDEQHRFGVEQRDALRQRSGVPPHLLVMTATPIPRTVAMTVFGDLEVSTLRELPAGRAPVTTHVVPLTNPRYVERTWQRVAEEVAGGGRVYVVCPRIGGGEGDEEGARAEPEEGARKPAAGAVEVLELLRARPELVGVRMALLHGRMRPEDKDGAMRAFARGDVDLLVATTVVEVGVDVPEATAVVVVDADRFGVSQVHQLRGRVGRGSRPGLCLLLTELEEGPAVERLHAVAATTDGFELARVDLESRREGDVLGAAQSGVRSSLRLLRALRDEDVISRAREAAVELVGDDPDLVRHPALARAIADLLDPDREAFLERG